MRRDQLEHIIRASTEIIHRDEVLIFGSQAILGAWSEDQLPPSATFSMEADLSPADPDEINDDELVNSIETALGQSSLFDETHGYYGEGNSAIVAILPPDWRTRLIVICNDNTGGRRGLCLDPYDLCVAKLAAGREKDNSFVWTLIQDGKIVPSKLNRRIKGVSTELLSSKRKGALQSLVNSFASHTLPDEESPGRRHQRQGRRPAGTSDGGQYMSKSQSDPEVHL